MSKEEIVVEKINTQEDDNAARARSLDNAEVFKRIETLERENDSLRTEVDSIKHKPKRKYGYARLSHDGIPEAYLVGDVYFKVNRYLILLFGVLLQQCVGTLYAFSVFNDPIEKERPGWDNAGFIFAVAIFMLGASASFAGTVVEKYGPTTTGTISGFCMGIGHLLAAIAVAIDQEWLAYVGFGFINGMGLGFGYVTPVSPMVKWFPDKRGLASGCAVAGFGLGAFAAGLINSELIDLLGVSTTLLIMAVEYFSIIMISAQYLCKPPPNWTPEGFDYAEQARRICEGPNLTTKSACATKHFGLGWLVLLSGAVVGVSTVSQAKPMQEDVYDAGKSTASLFVSIWSLCNCAGRLLWSLLSDAFARNGLSRRFVYTIMCGVQGGLCFIIILIGTEKSLYWLFCIVVAIVMSCYGGVFGVMPAFLADLFGPKNVGAVHGVILTAWAVAGGIGSILITTIKEQRKKNYSGIDLYVPFYIFGIAIMAFGCMCSIIVRPLVDSKGTYNASLDLVNRFIKCKKVPESEPANDSGVELDNAETPRSPTSPGQVSVEGKEGE